MQFEDLFIQLERKRIKNIYLSIDPRSGQVRLRVPRHLKDDEILQFLKDKKAWLDQKLSEFQPEDHALKPNHPISHLGKTYFLDLRAAARAQAYLEERWLVLALKDPAQAEALLTSFRKQELTRVLQELIEQWCPRMGVSVQAFQVRDMHTRWGSCTPQTKRIRFSLELSRKPLECIEYVVVHELAHLLERGHNKKFYAIMDRFLPDWKQRKKQLNGKKLDDECENGVS